MPRTAKLTDAPRGKQLPDETKTPGYNGPDREEALFMMGQFLAADAKVKEARDARKRLRNQAKLRGFDLEQFDLAIKEREKEDGTTIEGLKSFKRYCEFLGLPAGSQMQLFDSPNGGTSQQSVNEKAFQAGFELGVFGKNPDEQAYPPISPEGQEHARGWHDGQRVNLEKFEKLNADMTAAAAKKAKKRGDAEDDDENGDGETKH